jgi:RimJ/RimL family protein N-acetyltransferase
LILQLEISKLHLKIFLVINKLNNRLSNEIKIRNIIESDLQVFFEQQLDPDANQMAAFTSKDPADRRAFDTKWEKILADDTITIRTILFNDAVAGHVVSHSWFGDPEISYWIGKEYWGKGIASESLMQFLTDLKQRPLFARVVKDNIGSMRVLEKCGFVVSGSDKGFANARGKEVEEIIYKID